MSPKPWSTSCWAAHEIVRREDGESLLWVDRHYVHEGSFHAFGKLAERGVPVAEPGLTFGVADHYVPTRGSRTNIANPELARMVRQVEENTARHNVKLFGLGDPRQGIVHVVGPEQGLTLARPADRLRRQPHLDRSGALGAYAVGIGASEVAHVLMTQTDLAGEAEADARHGRRRGGARHLRQGHRARDHRAHWRRRRHWRRAGVCGLGDPGAVDRGPAHALQHVDRGPARAAGSSRRTRPLLRISRGRPYAPKGADFDKAVEEWSTDEVGSRAPRSTET